MPSVRLAGVGGARLRAAGVPLWADLTELSVMGFAEVVRHLPRLVWLRRHLVERARRAGVDLFLPVDYPGFHVAMAGRLEARGIPTLDFIPPKTWSWGGFRNRALRRSVTRCAVIFPFEADYYAAHGIDARYVGHPLMDLLGDAPVLPPGQRSGLLLVPGSRRQELARIAPILGPAAARLRERHGSSLEVRVSRAPDVPRTWLAPILEACPGAQVVEGPLFGALGRARVAVVTSGTATLEAALAGTPHVIVYRTSPVSYAVARRLATVEHIGMVNIVLGRRAIPELLQADLTSAAVAREISVLGDAEAAATRAQCQAFEELRARLGGPGAFDRVADMAVEMLDRQVR